MLGKVLYKKTHYSHFGKSISLADLELKDFNISTLNWFLVHKVYNWITVTEN